MKICIFLASLVVATSAINEEFVAQMKAKMKESVESCAKEVSASDDDVAQLLSHKIPDSHTGKCVVFCVHRGLNAQNEDGSLNMEGALGTLEMVKDIDPDLYKIVLTALKNCVDTPKDSDPCVYAGSLSECVIKQSKELGLKESVIE